MLAIEDFSSKVVNAFQPLVERYLEYILCPVDIYNPQPSSEVHQNTDARIQSGKRALASFVATDPAACFPRVWAPQLLFPLAFFFSAWRITSFKKSNYSRLFIVFVRLKLCTYIRLSCI